MIGQLVVVACCSLVFLKCERAISRMSWRTPRTIATGVILLAVASLGLAVDVITNGAQWHQIALAVGGAMYVIGDRRRTTGHGIWYYLSER